MSEILNHNGEGKSRHSLLDAISKAVAKSIKGHNGMPASVNVIVEGYEFDGEEYVAKVRVMLMPHDLETDNRYHEKEEERQDHQKEAENVAVGFTAATYDIGFFNSTHDKALQMLEAQIQDIITIDGKVILIASDEVHDLLRQEAKELTQKQENNLDLQALELGPGSGSSGHKEDAA